MMRVKPYTKSGGSKMVICEGCQEQLITRTNGGFFVTYVYPQDANEIPDVWRVCSVMCIKEVMREVVR